MLSASQFYVALIDMIDPEQDGPRDAITFVYRGSLYVRLAQFEQWLRDHGQDVSQAEAADLLRRFGLRRYAYKYMPATGSPTSLSTFRSDNPVLVDGLPEWQGPRMARGTGTDAAQGSAEETDETDRPAVEADGRPGDGSGRLDAKLRFVVEHHAEDQVIVHYESEGWEVERVGHMRPGWDLTARRGHDEEHRIEVKGSTGPAAAVELTANEVKRAREHADQAVLAIVSNIKLDGEKPSNGAVELVDRWEPDDQDLAITRYTYIAPTELRRRV